MCVRHCARYGACLRLSMKLAYAGMKKVKKRGCLRFNDPAIWLNEQITLQDKRLRTRLSESRKHWKVLS